MYSYKPNFMWCVRACVSSPSICIKGGVTNDNDLQYNFTYFTLNFLFEMLQNTITSLRLHCPISETNTRNKGTCGLLL